MKSLRTSHTTHVKKPETPGLHLSASSNGVNTKSSLANVLGKYPRDLSLAPVKMPLSDICTDVKNFQIRKTPYSETSVRKMISALKEGFFYKELFAPINLRHNPEDNKCYVLSGHSRLEFFHRLSDPFVIDEETGSLLHDHPGVKAFLEKHEIDFQHIWAHVFEQMNLEEAKFVAAISNTLGTLETPLERAFAYHSMRRYFNFTDVQLAKKFATNEGKNRATTLALSHLNPHGKTLQTLDSLQGNDDTYKDMLKISKWIGEARRKHQTMSDLHENELFEWLIEHEKYGFGENKISTEHIFISTVTDHISKLIQKNEFKGNRRLNILKQRRYSYALRQYELHLASLRKKVDECRKGRQTIENQVAKMNATLNKSIITEEDQTKIQAFSTQIEQQTKELIELKIKEELIEGLRFKFPGRDKDRLLRVQEILHMEYVAKELFKGKRGAYIEAEQNQTSLFSFDEEDDD